MSNYYKQFQIEQSTAEEWDNYFYGDTSPSIHSFDYETIMPAGKYRVINGQLCRILPGFPPDIKKRFTRK